jgi:hypothetical protein
MDMYQTSWQKWNKATVCEQYARANTKTGMVELSQAMGKKNEGKYK